jgi:molecular chaperone DnaK (HSP70)
VDEIEILVYQGDRPDGSEGNIMISDCVKVSEVILSGFQDRKAGDSEIKVKFDIDSNGLLKVTATDVRSGNSKEL